MLFVDRYQEITERYPNEIAIIEGENQTTHQELWQQAEQICAFLQRKGIQPQSRIGLYIGKSTALIASILGSWMAGVIFIPLDPTLPKKRLLFYIEDADLSGILCQQKPNFSEDIRNPMFELSESMENPKAIIHQATPEQPAYLIYSSGSTGQPKGVLVSHQGLPIVLLQQISVLQLTPKDRVFWFLSMQFDASISDIGVSLLSGATLVIEPEIELESIPQILEKYEITYADLPPALLGVFSPSEFPSSLRSILIGGEPCPLEDIERYQQVRDIILVYGPTEATICSSLVLYSQSKNIQLHSIGFPLEGVKYHIEDEELWIGGDILALEYWNREELNQRKWVWKDGERYFRTGDRVKRAENGEFLFRGRLDRQLKIHGKLIAPEEIERCYRELSEVSRAAVLTKKTSTKEQLYVFLEASEPISLEDCNQRLKNQLPDWLIPKQGQICTSLPLTPSGKIDYLQLEQELQQSQGQIQEQIDKQMRKQMREQMIDVWRKLFETSLGKEVDIYDDFFELGGDSIAVLSLIAEAKEKGLYLTPQILKSHSSPFALALWGGEKNIDRISSRELLEKIQENLHLETLPSSKPKNPALILLTGATGFLGGRVLWMLLLRGKRVRVLVRADSIEKATERVRENLETYELQVNLEQLEVCCGDLNDQEAVDRFVGSEPAILFHCAADTSLTKDLEELMDSNVHSCLSLYRHPQLLINHASTLSVFVSSNHHKGRFTEDQKLKPDVQTRILGGYAQSKWMAEVLADYRNARIFRFGLLTGDREKFIHPRRDWLAFFLQGIFELQLIPNVDIDRFAIDITPIDYAVSAFVELGLNPNSSGRYHINAPRALKLSELLAVFEMMELSISLVSPFLFTQIYKQIPEPTFAMKTAYLALSKLLDERENEDYHSLDIFLATEVEFDASRAISQSGITPPEPSISYMIGLIRNIIMERRGV